MDFFEVTQELLQGFGVTILLFALTWIIAIPLGVLFCRMTLSRLKGLHYFMTYTEAVTKIAQIVLSGVYLN